MTLPRWITVTLPLLALGVGCHNGKNLNNPQVYQAAATNVADIRARYQRLDPANQVGLVIASEPSANLVAVGEINPANVRVGDKVVFVDSRENALTTGTIVRKLTNALHVEYDPPAAGHRAPRDGDVMVRFRPAT
jgi:hypothetical protein